MNTKRLSRPLADLLLPLPPHLQSLYEDDDPEEEEQPTLNLTMAIVLLVVSTALVGVTSEWLVDTIDGVTCTGNISKTWVGLILLPIVSNAAEHVSAVTGAYKAKMDLAMGIAVGSSIQISIFVIPLLTIISWIASKPLSLLFDPFVAILLFLAVLVVNYAIADGKSNYMEGFVLMMVFLGEYKKEQGREVRCTTRADPTLFASRPQSWPS